MFHTWVFGPSGDCSGHPCYKTGYKKPILILTSLLKLILEYCMSGNVQNELFWVQLLSLSKILLIHNVMFASFRNPPFQCIILSSRPQLFIQSPIGRICVASTLGLLWIKPCWTFVHISFYRQIFLFPLDKYLTVKSLGSCSKFISVLC